MDTVKKERRKEEMINNGTNTNKHFFFILFLFYEAHFFIFPSFQYEYTNTKSIKL